MKGNTMVKKSTEFEFVDELPSKSDNGRIPHPVYVEFASALRDNPGQWAKWPRPIAYNGIGTTAWRINHGVKGAPPSLITGEFEAATRAGVLYVRFVGKPSKRRGTP